MTWGERVGLGYDCCERPDWVDDDVDGHCACRSCGKTEQEAEQENAGRVGPSRGERP